MNQNSKLQYYIEPESESEPEPELVSELELESVSESELEPKPEYYKYSEQQQSLGFSYENILDNLNVRISDGILYNKNKQNKQKNQKEHQGKFKTRKQDIVTNNSDKNSYIRNKYFNSFSSAEPEIKILRPKNLAEYRKMVILQAIENHNRNIVIKNMKSTKLAFCHDHIQIRSHNNGPQDPINALFGLKK